MSDKLWTLACTCGASVTAATAPPMAVTIRCVKCGKEIPFDPADIQQPATKATDAGATTTAKAAGR